MSFTLGILVGALAGYLVGTHGSRAARTMRDYRDTRSLIKKLGGRRMAHMQTAALAWIGLAALILFAVSLVNR